MGGIYTLFLLVCVVEVLVRCTYMVQVGHVYGRRMLKGVLESKGRKISEGRVAATLRRVAPSQYEQRRHDAVDRLNPSPYIALYFGHKLHLDQNEKLGMFGVTHVVAKDGFSKIVGFPTMPVKNNLAICILSTLGECEWITMLFPGQLLLKLAYGVRFGLIMAGNSISLS